MPELKEYIALAKSIQDKEQTRHVHELRSALPRITDITHKAQTVLDHPGWQFFADSLETRVQAIEQKRAVKTRQMIFGTEMGHELELVKIELNVMDAEIAGLRYAAGLIPDAIETGGIIRAAAGSVAD